MNEGLLVLRIGIALILFMHATQKLFGWFHGPGLIASTAVFRALGQTPARPMVCLAAGCEVMSAASVALGLITFAGAAVGAGVMFVAGGSLTLRAGRIWNTAGGGEYPFVLGLVLIAIGFAGPGRYSLDGAFSQPWYAGREIASYWVGLGALTAAIVFAVAPLTKARVTLRRAGSAPVVRG